MITPKFTVSQDDEFVILRMHVKSIKASDCDFYMMDKDFKFYCRPYFLRLTFSHEIIDDGREKAAYNADSGELVVHIPKGAKGQNFENLDMLATLMGISDTGAGSDQSVHPFLQVLSAQDPNAPLPENMELAEDDDIDWSFPQTLQADAEIIAGSQRYGFNNLYSNFFTHIQSELSDVIDNPDPEHLSPQERRQKRILHEIEHFDEDYYISDYMMDEEIQEVLHFKTVWEKELEQRDALVAQLTTPAEASIGPDQIKTSMHKIEEQAIHFSEEDMEALVALPLKEYVIADERPLLLALVDLMFAYCYNHRTTTGDHTVESAWTVAKLSPTIQWFDSFSSPYEVTLACFKRSLCFPLWRHFDLSTAVLEDTKRLFSLGKRAILRTLLDIQRLFADADHQHYFNGLFIEDFCIWTQTVSRKTFQRVSQELNKVVITKEAVDLSLDELEQLGKEGCPYDGTQDTMDQDNEDRMVL